MPIDKIRNSKFEIRKRSLRAQVYLIVIFALTFTFIVFFVLTSPLSEQAKNIVIVSNSYKAIATAATGLEIELLKALKPGGPSVNPSFDPGCSLASPVVSGGWIELTGQCGSTQRTLFLQEQ